MDQPYDMSREISFSDFDSAGGAQRLSQWDTVDANANAIDYTLPSGSPTDDGTGRGVSRQSLVDIAGFVNLPCTADIETSTLASCPGPGHCFPLGASPLSCGLAHPTGAKSGVSMESSGRSRRRNAAEETSSQADDSRPLKLKKRSPELDLPKDDVSDPAAVLARMPQTREDESKRFAALSKPFSQTRVPHNLIERRYRDNLNGQIETLRLCLPTLREAHLVPVNAAGYAEDGTTIGVPPKTPSKAVVISTAVGYIKELEMDKARLQADVTAMREQIGGLEKLVNCVDCSVLQYISNLQLDDASAAPVSI